MTAPAIPTRKPTGAVAAPCILVEGGDKVGKSWLCAELSASPRVGQMYWLDLSVDGADEYGAIPGVRYLLLEHGGTWPGILDAVRAAKGEAQRAADAGEKPVVLTVDTMTFEWNMHKAWADARARRQKFNREKLRQDPHAEIVITSNLWNDATERHYELMTMLLTFPGIVVLTARGGEVTAFDDNGRPIPGTKTYRVEGQKNLVYDVSAVVRLSRDHPPMIMGGRSVHLKTRPGIDQPTAVKNLTLDHLIFDILKYDPAVSHARKLTALETGGQAVERSTPTLQDDNGQERRRTPDGDMVRVWAEQLSTVALDKVETVWWEVVSTKSDTMTVPGTDTNLRCLLVGVLSANVAASNSPEQLRELWGVSGRCGVIDDQCSDGKTLRDLIKAQGEKATPAAVQPPKVGEEGQKLQQQAASSWGDADPDEEPDVQPANDPVVDDPETWDGDTPPGDGLYPY